MNPPLVIATQPKSTGLTGRLHASMVAVACRLSVLRSALRPFGPRPRESAMQFAAHGRLSCICAPLRPRHPGPERRRVCRTCGLQIRVLSRNVDRNLTSVEIQAAVRNLQLAGIRSASLEIPSSIMTLRQLNLYLASDACKQPRTTPPLQPSVSPSQIN